MGVLPDRPKTVGHLGNTVLPTANDRSSGVGAVRPFSAVHSIEIVVAPVERGFVLQHGRCEGVKADNADPWPVAVPSSYYFLIVEWPNRY